MEKSKDILRVGDVAKLLDSHPKTIQKLLRNGKLEGYKVLGKWFILRPAVISFIKSHEHEIK